MPSPCFLPIENCGDRSSDAFDTAVMDLLQRSNLPQAEILVRMGVARFGPSAKAMNFLGWIASTVGLPDYALDYFAQAARAAPAWRLPQINREMLLKFLAAPSTAALQATKRYLLIKAWGCGFWSDVSHVIGQLLLAELTGRTPIVHWGSNSLFRDATASNAFDAYFEPVSQATAEDLRDAALRIWPPKWNHVNLFEGALNQWRGPISRIPGLYLLGRDEEIVVSDFYTSVLDLQPWIPATNALHGMLIDQLHSHLLTKYLRPKPDITHAVDVFHARYLASDDYLAVHMRGSDKILEVKGLDALNGEYRRLIDEFRSRHGIRKIFLLTDDLRLKEGFSQLFPGEVISTECQRTATAQGIHYQALRDPRQLGREVMVDTYLAVRAKAFIGNGLSNPSLIVRYLKAWPEGAVRLIGPNMYREPNTFLHKW